MAAAEQILEIFDLYWFETTVLSKKSLSSSPSTSTQNTFPQRQRVATIRSFTDQTMASTTTNSAFWEGGNRKTMGQQSGHKVRPRLELEIKELKGFMDLGFVFSEEDKGCPRLVSLIPGLQKMGRRRSKEKEEEGNEKKRKVRKKEINPMMLYYWKVPISLSSNEIDMKHNLRFWAHSVASIISPSSCSCYNTK